MPFVYSPSGAGRFLARRLASASLAFLLTAGAAAAQMPSYGSSRYVSSAWAGEAAAHPTQGVVYFEEPLPALPMKPPPPPAQITAPPRAPVPAPAGTAGRPNGGALRAAGYSPTVWRTGRRDNSRGSWGGMGTGPAPAGAAAAQPTQGVVYFEEPLPTLPVKPPPPPAPVPAHARVPAPAAVLANAEVTDCGSCSGLGGPAGRRCATCGRDSPVPPPLGSYAHAIYGQQAEPSRENFLVIDP